MSERHIGMSHSTKGLDCTFSNTILITGINTTEGQLLLMGIKMTTKLLGGKDPIVSMKELDCHANIKYLTLKM